MCANSPEAITAIPGRTCHSQKQLETTLYNLQTDCQLNRTKINQIGLDSNVN